MPYLVKFLINKVFLMYCYVSLFGFLSSPILSICPFFLSIYTVSWLYFLSIYILAVFPVSVCLSVSPSVPSKWWVVPYILEITQYSDFRDQPQLSQPIQPSWLQAFPFEFHYRLPVLETNLCTSNTKHWICWFCIWFQECRFTNELSE